MDNCRKTLADGFGLKSYQKVDNTFYMDLAAVASRLDFEAENMAAEEQERLRKCWGDLVASLDRGLTNQL